MSKKTKVLLGVLIALLVALLAGGAILWQTGYFAKPVNPDNFWTLRNLSIDAGEEEIALAPEARVRAVKGEDKFNLEFELGMNEQTLMPLRGEISEDGVLFTIGNGGRVYSADMETLGALIGLGEGDAEMLERLEDLIESYAALLKVGMDHGFAEKNANVYSEMYEIMLNTTAEDVKVEVEGKSHSGKHYAGKLTGESLCAMLDYMRACEIEEVADMMDDLLACVSYFAEEKYASYADLMAGMGDAISADVDLTVAMGKKLNYQKISMQQDGADGMAIDSTAESTMTDKGMTMTMQQSMGDPEENGTVQNISFALTGPMNAPSAFRFDMDYDSTMDYSTQDYTNIMGLGMTMNMAGNRQDGLWNVELDGDITNRMNYGSVDTEEEIYTDETTVSYNGSYAETKEEDGSVTGAFALKFGDDEMDYGASFELNRGKTAVIEQLVKEDTKLYELSADTTDEVYTQLGADAMDFVADAAQLTTDEGVMQLVDLFSMSAQDEADSEAIDEEYTYEGDIQQVETMEEAAAIYGGMIPEFTAPQGYKISVINVNDGVLEAIYDNGENRFAYSLIDFEADTGAEPEITYGDDGEGTIYYADLMMDSSYVLFSFEDGVTRADAEAILAGLNLE